MLFSTLALAAASASLAVASDTPAPVYTVVRKDVKNDYATFEVQSDASDAVEKVSSTLTEFYGLRVVSCKPDSTSVKTVKCDVADKRTFPWFTKYEVMCPSATPNDCNINSATSHDGKTAYFRGFSLYKGKNGQFEAVESNLSDKETPKIAQEVSQLYSGNGVTCKAAGNKLDCKAANGQVPFEHLRATCAYTKDFLRPDDCIAMNYYTSSHLYYV